MTRTDLQRHFEAVRHFAERGLTRDGHVVPAQVLREHSDRGDNEWQLFVGAGPNLLHEGPGAMLLWTKLSEIVVEPHDYLDDDKVETVAHARLRTSGEFAQTIASLAGWLLAHGWRGEGGRLVSHEVVRVEFIVADGALYVLQPGGEGGEPIES